MDKYKMFSIVEEKVEHESSRLKVINGFMFLIGAASVEDPEMLLLLSNINDEVAYDKTPASILRNIIEYLFDDVRYGSGEELYKKAAVLLQTSIDKVAAGIY